MKILLYINDPDDTVLKKLTGYIEETGLDAEVESAASMQQVILELKSGSYDAVITQYKVGPAELSERELEAMAYTDEKVNVVIVIPADKRGSEYCAGLLGKGITSGLFEGEASVRSLIGIATHQRGKKDAKEYYGLNGESAKKGKRARSIVNPEQIRELYNFLSKGDGKGDTFLERLEYITSRVSEEELIEVLKLLTEEEAEAVCTDERYAKYFSDKKPTAGTDAKAELVKLGGALGDFLKSGGELLKSGTEYIKTGTERLIIPPPVETRLVGRTVVGVLGLYRGSGALDCAVSLAASLSAYGDVSFVEIPSLSTEHVYERYHIGEDIGPGFVSVPHALMQGGDLSGIRNNSSGINFYISDPAYGPAGLDSAQNTMMVLGASGNAVVYLGEDYEQASRQGVFPLVEHLVIVYESGQEERYLSCLKETLEKVSRTRMRPALLRTTDRLILSKEAEYEGSEYSVTVRRPLADRIEPLRMNSRDGEGLAAEFGLAKRKKESGRGRKQRKAVGTREIALFGATPKCGTTWTAWMMADSLRKRYRVAYLELNGSGHMKRVEREFEFDSGCMMSLKGVDMYYGIDYRTFADSFRGRYDFVFIDFGTADDLEKNKDVFSVCQQKYMLVDASPWNAWVMDLLPHRLERWDRERQIKVLVWLSDREEIRHADVYRRCGRRQVFSVPFCKVPLGCNNETTGYFSRFFEN